MVKLSDAQFNKLSDILANIGLLTLGSTVIPALFTEFNLIALLSGAVLSALIWISTLWLVR